jgi:metal-responsive CopG/Arc/MetJ family transcriptional regulator
MGKRNTKVIGFSVPPEIYEEVLEYAKKEKKTKSELFREMVAVYRRKKEEEEYKRLLEYGRLKALEAGIKSEQDVERAIDEFRKA